MTLTASVSIPVVAPGRARGGGRTRHAGTRRHAVGHRTGFVIVALAFATAMAFSTLPAPLYPLYQEKDGLSTLVITLVFAAYALGVAVSLFLVGHVSDWLGRRRIILIALVVELVAAVLLIASSALPVFLIARVASGFGVGLITASATAHLAELRAAAPGRTDPAAVAALANLGGLAIGPLVGGVLAQYVPAPLEVPFLVFAVLLALATLFVAAVPETVDVEAQRRSYRPQRIAVPAGARGTYAAAAAAAFGGFAVFGLFASLTPTVLAEVMGVTSQLAAGLVTAAVFAAAAVAQLAARGLRLRTLLIVAFALAMVGLAALSAAVILASLAMLVVAALVAGAAVGLLFRGSLAVGEALAPEGARGEALAGIFLAAYLGLIVPSLGVGLVLTAAPIVPTVAGFALVVAILVGSATPVLVRQAAGLTEDDDDAAVSRRPASRPAPSSSRDRAHARTRTARTARARRRSRA